MERRTVAKHFRYAGVVVRVVLEKTARGLPDVVQRIEAVRPFGRLVEARKGRFPRHAMHYAPLPRKYVALIEAAGREAEHRERVERIEATGVKVEEAKPADWGALDLRGRASAVAT